MRSLHYLRFVLQTSTLLVTPVAASSLDEEKPGYLFCGYVVGDFCLLRTVGLLTVHLDTTPNFLAAAGKPVLPATMTLLVLLAAVLLLPHHGAQLLLVPVRATYAAMAAPAACLPTGPVSSAAYSWLCHWLRSGCYYTYLPATICAFYIA